MIATRPVLALAGGALSLLALAACSSGGSDDTSSSAAASPAASAAAGGGGTGGPGGADFAAYRDCLAQNGVTLPDFGGNGGGTPPSGMPTGAPPSGMTPPSGMPSGGPDGGGPNGGGMQLPEGVDQATWDAAQQACASVAPQGGFGGGQPQPQAS